MRHCSIENFSSLTSALAKLPESLETLKLNLKYNYNLNLTLAGSRDMFRNLTRLQSLSLHLEDNNMDESGIVGLAASLQWIKHSLKYLSIGLG